MNTSARQSLDLEVCILVGGQSRRMGRDKSRLRLGTRTLLGQVRAAAKQLGLPVRTVRRDAVPRCGPLGGICTALARTRADAVIFLACDMPFVSRRLLGRLVRHGAPRRDAVFVSEAGRVGFPFVLRRRVLPRVQNQIAAGEGSLQALATALRAGRLRVPRGLAKDLENINTPAEWRQARRRWHDRRLVSPPRRPPAPRARAAPDG